jgi:hypothetical protein
MPQAYKIRESFGTNPISMKRDYKALLSEREGYVAVESDGMRAVSF